VSFDNKAFLISVLPSDNEANKIANETAEKIKIAKHVINKILNGITDFLFFINRLAQFHLTDKSLQRLCDLISVS
jgi:hypothetical protein